MANLDPSYALCFPLQESILDKDTGLPLVGGIVTFYSDVNRSVLKDVYQLSESPGPTYTYNSLGPQLVLGNAGQFVDGSGNNIIPWLWLYDGDPSTTTNTPELYYITVYAAAPPVGSGLLQFTAEAWPGVEVSNTQNNQLDANVNQITNPQFVETFLNFGDTVISVTGSNTSTQIAPDWRLVTTGTGTVTITQDPLSLTDVPGNAPYALTFSAWSGSITEAYLIQTLTDSPNILAGSTVNAQMAVASNDSVAHQFTMNVISPTAVSTTVAQGYSTSSSSFVSISGVGSTASIALPAATASAPPDATVISITLPVNTLFSITSIQLVGVLNENSTAEFLQQTQALQKSNLYHYYEDAINFKPTKSYLIGWDFPANPAQFGSTVAAQALGVNTAYYAWDQTIVFQTATSGWSIARATNGNLGLTAAATGQVALIQYLEGVKAQRIFEQVYLGNVSVMVRMASTVTQRITVTLAHTDNASLPDITANDCVVTSLASDGTPTLVAGWTALARANYLPAVFDCDSTAPADFGINGWQDFSDFSADTFFAIIVSTDSVTSANNLQFGSVSLVPGNIPTIPAPQDPTEVLLECSRYYETSYVPGTSNPAGTIDTTNAITCPMNGYNNASGACYLTPSPFTINYKAQKVSNATPKLYSSAAGTADKVTNNLFFYLAAGNAYSATGAADSTVATWWTTTAGYKASNYSPTASGTALATNGAANTGDTRLGTSGYVQFHYIVDARLGTF